MVNLDELVFGFIYVCPITPAWKSASVFPVKLDASSRNSITKKSIIPVNLTALPATLPLCPAGLARASICNEMEVQIGDFLEPRTISIQPVSLKLVSQDQLTNQGKATHNVRRIGWRECSYAPGVVLWKKHIVNSYMGHGMTNSKTSIRFENDAGNKKWRTENRRRNYKAGKLVGIVAAVLAAPGG